MIPPISSFSLSATNKQTNSQFLFRRCKELSLILITNKKKQGVPFTVETRLVGRR